MNFRYAIIGGGVAGTRAAEEIRKYDAAGRIALIDDEREPLYSRVLLPPYLKGKIPRERVFIFKEAWYAAARVERIFSRVRRVDASHQELALDNGAVLGYEKLLIASGGDVRHFDQAHPRRLFLRTLRDADEIARTFQECSAEFTAARPFGIVGGGFIALDFLNLARARVFPARLMFRSKHFLDRVLGEQSSMLLEDYLRAHGAEIISGAGIARIAAALQDCPAVGFGLGLKPCFDFLEGTGIALAGGVRCNANLESSLPNIWAAGDIAEYDDVITGGTLITGTWMNADFGGRHVGRAMATGKREPFRLVASYTARLYDLPLTAIGDARLDHAERAEEIPDGEAIIGRRYRGEKLIGATIVGPSVKRAELVKEIEAGSF